MTFQFVVDCQADLAAVVFSAIRCTWSPANADYCIGLHYSDYPSLPGEGKMSNRRCLEWHLLAHQKCAKLCHGIQESIGTLVGASAICL